MILDRKNRNELRVLDSSNLNLLAGHILRPTGRMAPKEDAALTKLLKFLNTEFDLSKEVSKNHHLLWLKDEEITGSIIVTDIVKGSEAKIKCHLSEDAVLEQEEIQENLKNMIDRVFETFDLQRVIFHIKKGVSHVQPEETLLSIYQCFPVGLLHVDQEFGEFVIPREQSQNRREFYTI